jgi:Holliday junction resolvase-like predicted endonuclease
MRTSGTSTSGPDARDAKPSGPRHTLGRRGEQFAAEHLQRLGFSPLGRNERTRYGEIDLIAFDGRTLVFISRR